MYVYIHIYVFYVRVYTSVVQLCHTIYHSMSLCILCIYIYIYTHICMYIYIHLSTFMCTPVRYGCVLCNSCKQFSVSQERSESEEECYCIVGYSRNVDEDVPNTNSDIVRQKTGVGGWRMVQFMPSRGHSNRWYKMCHTLRGTITVGNAFNYTADWTIPFGDFDQLLLGTYNLTHWMHLPQSSTRGTSWYGNNDTSLSMSSYNPFYVLV